MKSKTFEIISFTADSKTYYPASMKHESWMPDNYVKHTAISIAPGQSRYGGPVIDMPPGVAIPENLRFSAQLDMKVFAPFDKTGLLPKQGHLLFFSDIIGDTGKVIYADIPNESLVRVIEEHEDNFFSGVLIDKVSNDTENWEDRFYEEDGETEWDYFAGSDKSKIFGIYTHCQLGEEEIEEITNSDKVLLLQVGENGFNEEGVFSVLIPKEDLKALNFNNCEFAWGQS